MTRSFLRMLDDEATALREAEAQAFAAYEEANADVDAIFFGVGATSHHLYDCRDRAERDRLRKSLAEGEEELCAASKRARAALYTWLAAKKAAAHLTR